MRAGAYYALAIALVLVTVPMYRYISVKSREVPDPDRSGHLRVIASSVPSEPVSVPLVRELRLLPGEQCVAGYVLLVNGSTYSQVVDGSGQRARCVGNRVLR